MKEIYGMKVRETLDELLDIRQCALVTIDLQNDFVNPKGKLARGGKSIEMLEAVVPRCVRLICAARELNVLIVHVKLVTLEGGRSDSPAWMHTRLLLSGDVNDVCLDGTWGADFCDGCAPEAGDLVITKHRPSAFVGTNIAQVLRANSIETIAVIGEQTHGCVEATMRDASHNDFYTVLIEDCVGSFEPELHEASLQIQRTRHLTCSSADAVGVWRTQAGASRHRPAVDEPLGIVTE